MATPPAWLLIQAAQLSWEIRSILPLIHGVRLNLTEELSIRPVVKEAVTKYTRAC